MLNNFVGEFLVLQGAAQANFTWTVFAAIGVILSACYMLWLYQRVFFGEAVRRGHAITCPTSTAREWAARHSAGRHDGLDGRLSRRSSCRRSARPTRGFWNRRK